MTLSGYVVMPASESVFGSDFAFGLLAGLGARYVGQSADNAILAAFDAGDWGAALRYTEHGKVYMLSPHPDDPDSWPDWARGPRPSVPKRGVAVGDERFVLLRPTKHSANELHSAVAPQARASAVVSSDGESLVLVELGASDPFIADAEVVFDRTITEYRDARLLTSV